MVTNAEVRTLTTKEEKEQEIELSELQELKSSYESIEYHNFLKPSEVSSH